MKTAMQELLSEMSHPNWDRLSFDARYEMFDILLEKEKEQIMDSFDYGYYCASNGTSAEITLDGKMHYNQTYNQNK